MQQSLLVPWAPFYQMIGTAAASLTGLMFVAVTLVLRIRARQPGLGISTFSTPTIVHFGSAIAIR